MTNDETRWLTAVHELTLLAAASASAKLSADPASYSELRRESAARFQVQLLFPK